MRSRRLLRFTDTRLRGVSAEVRPRNTRENQCKSKSLGGQRANTHVLSRQIEVMTSDVHCLRKPRRLAGGGRRRGDSARATGGGVTADRRGNSILPTVSSYLIEPIGRPLCIVVCILFSDNNNNEY